MIILFFYISYLTFSPFIESFLDVFPIIDMNRYKYEMVIGSDMILGQWGIYNQCIIYNIQNE